MATVDAMRIANKEMKRQYKGIDIDKIESIHYDMEDLIEQANEIQESLGRSYGVPDEVDEEELQAGECDSERRGAAAESWPRTPPRRAPINLAIIADPRAELDALGLDDELVGENEAPSYLSESTALPDFVDAEPVEEAKEPTAEVAR